jgi:outer membrane protein with beta-barrel domain
MRELTCVIFCLLSGVIALCQDFPNAEVFAGYSYANVGISGATNRVSLNGWNGSLTWNANRTLGITGDFTGVYGSPQVAFAPICIATVPPCLAPTILTKVSARNHTFLFGPQLSYRAHEKVVPFGHALFGVGHSRESASGVTLSSNAFAMAFGGGADYNFNRKAGWRTQFDYVNTRFFNDTQHNIRLSTGIVFRVGE